MLEIQESRELRVRIAAVSQPAVLPAPEVVHQTGILDVTVRVCSQGNMAVQEAGLGSRVSA